MSSTKQTSRTSLKCGPYVGTFFPDDMKNSRPMTLIDKEVLGYYDDGMQVPDDITLLFSDDKCVLESCTQFCSLKFLRPFDTKLGKYGTTSVTR